MAGHTPGPWMVAKGSKQFICSDGLWIASTMGVRGEIGEANARLIAASPTILEAGQFLADRLDEFERELCDDEVFTEFNGHVAPALARFRAAISLATGAA